MCRVSFPICQPLPHPGKFSVTGNHFGVGMWSTAKLTLLSKTQVLADLCFYPRTMNLAFVIPLLAHLSF